MPDIKPGHVWRWLWAWTGLWALIHVKGAGGSWHYFAQGSQLLFGDDRGEGLHLYAAHPELQIGPLTFLVARPLQVLGPGQGRTVAVLLMSLTGPPLLAALWRLVPVQVRQPSRLLAAGLLFLPIWAELVTHAGHLDDVLALTCGVAAMYTLSNKNALATGLLVAAAADCKPWALAFAPLLLALPRREWWRAGLVAVVGLLVAWLPFLLYDPATINATRFAIPTALSSGLHVLGFTDPHTPPWDRPAQLLLGCLLGTIAVVRGRWPAVILLATSARILLDPEVYGYYTSGVLLGAVAFELIVARHRWPWLTLTGVLALYGVRLLGHVVPISFDVMAWLRVGYVVLVVAVVLLPGRAGEIPASDRDDAHDVVPSPL
ncbi:MAG: hypothetical protein QOE54_3154 [Streptosporangiaceae bacterium]|nr:conserved rane protein of unknown function [Streptosporangiaceae bacterium]MDX6430788.1 hypothetical protein [Streptosporangiaceae bacterium]